MNNKGQILGLGTILLAWKFLLILMLILFVVITLTPVFTAKQDARQNEVMTLSNNIVECAEKNGNVNPDFNIAGCVNLDEKEYYVNVSIFSLESDMKKEVNLGSPLEVACESIEKYTYKPACLKQRYYVLINNNGKVEKGILDLFVGIRRFNENQ
jgi:hypothetical protein